MEYDLSFLKKKDPYNRTWTDYFCEYYGYSIDRHIWLSYERYIERTLKYRSPEKENGSM